jgi:hypothetical protein
MFDCLGLSGMVMRCFGLDNYRFKCFFFCQRWIMMLPTWTFDFYEAFYSFFIYTDASTTEIKYGAWMHVCVSLRTSIIEFTVFFVVALKWLSRDRRKCWSESTMNFLSGILSQQCISDQCKWYASALFLSHYFNQNFNYAGLGLIMSCSRQESSITLLFKCFSFLKLLQTHYFLIWGSIMCRLKCRNSPRKLLTWWS